MQINLKGAVALITGAASGIGRATALALHASGARIAAADRDMAGLEQLTADIGALAVDMDVLKTADIADGVEKVETTLGPIAILVTAAGVLQRPRKADQLPQSEWDRVMAVNLRGTYITASTVGSRMAARGKGAIITVSSVMGYAPGPLHAYAPAKAAIISLTQSLACEWATQGVRVNGVAPGFTATPALNRAMSFGVLDEKRLSDSTPQARLITAEEVASAIVFLASDQASAINGVTLPVDGGYLASAGMRGFGP